MQGDTKGIFKRQEKHDGNYVKEESSNSYYEYVEFRHHNKQEDTKQNTRIKQGERKSHPDGWQTCCTRKVDDLPQNIIEYLRERHSRKKMIK